jgi:hypothetical protein
MPTFPDSEPPPKKYSLRDRPADSKPADNPQDKIDVHDLLGAAAEPIAPRLVAPPSSTRPPVPAANDIRAILRDNAARDPAKELPAPARSTRRRNDYLLLLLLGYGAMGGATYMIGPAPLTLFFAGGAAFVYTLALTWVMWFVMDRY